MNRTHGVRPQATGTLASQLEGLAQALADGDGLLTKEEMARGQELGARAEDRFHLSPEHTTVGFFGATGSGKSSLFNRVAGSEIARAGVTRPTTFEVTAAVWQESGAADLLDWLQVDQVWVAGEEPALVLLDLPDFDSVAQENRVVADRLVGQVDVLVWVVDPQKYGDRVIHQDYIQPLSHHASTTIVVLNQVDLVDEGEREQILHSLKQVLAEDGLSEAKVLTASALTGEGIGPLRSQITAIAEQQQAVAQRLSADVRRWAEDALTAASGGTSAEVPPVPAPKPKAVKELTRAVQAAAGVEVVGNAVASSYKKRSRQVTGWPLVSWMGRFRADPMKRLGIEKAANTGAVTSLPPLSSVSVATLNTAVRNFGAQVAANAPEGWRHQVTQMSSSSTLTLEDQLDRAVGQADYNVRRPWWWGIGRVLQYVLLAVALVGFGWYLAAWVTAAFALPLVPIAKVEGWPVPGLLIVFGLLAGVLLAALFAAFGSAGAARRKRAATASMRERIDAVVEAQVVTPISEATTRMNRLLSALLQTKGS